MKRSRHRWMELTVFCMTIIVLATELPTTTAVKATSLIFGKTSSTTAAPEELPPEGEDGLQTETTAEGDDVNNTTKKLTGIPQIDYLLDPNLPRELNGYNLSEYPFYETVPAPELMDFKCDGLHDGFYASVPHKCQVYHHCLYGTRYDFLCANYTAFDQKTFICHFVSEVDCKNSPNYFNRNEALYKAASTDPPPPPSTTTSTTTTTTTVRPPRPGRRRPVYRYDYYDDDYYYRDDYDYAERRPRPRPRPGGRPGNKNRPVDDYEDDRYERRPRPRDEALDDDFGDRRPYNRRPGKRRPYADDDDRRPGYRAGGGRRPKPRDDDEQYRSDVEDRPRGGKRDGPRDESRPKRPRDEYKPRDDSKPRDEAIPTDEDITKNEKDEIRPRDEISPRDEIKPKDESNSRDDSRSKDTIRPRDEFRPRDSIRPRDERRPLRDDSSDKPRDSRPRDDRYQNEGRRYRDDRPYRNRDEKPYSKPEKNDKTDDIVPEEKKEIPSAPEGQGLVKPSGHGLFSKPRAPPKIKRPVPLNERQKYEYVTIATTKPPPKAAEDEYYDYEEDETNKPSSSGKTATIQQRPKPEPVEKEKFRPSRPVSSNIGKGRKNTRPVDYAEEYYDEPVVKSEKYINNRRNKDERSKPKANVDDYYDYEEKKVKERKEEVEDKIKNIQPSVRVVKRPFLPSRGGSPYLPRGLQPVAGRDLTAPLNTTPKPTTTTTTTTPKPTTTTTEPTTTTTTTTTTIPTPTTTKHTTTVATEIPTTQHPKAYEEEYEYYDEDDIDYDKNRQELTTEKQTIVRIQTTAKPETTTAELTTQELKAKNLATKVLRVYNDNYEAIRGKLESTLSPGDYIKPYLATSIPFTQRTEDYKPKIKAEISKPYTATGKPLIPENISIKQNLADSIESDYDVRFNEALSPTLPVSRVPSGFISANRDYTFSRYRNNFQQAEPQFAASELTLIRSRPQVNIRTPSSYYLQPQLYQDEVVRHPRQLVRHVLGDFI